MKKIVLTVLALLAALLLLVSCAPNEQGEAPDVTDTPTAVQTSTPTPIPSRAPKATPTPLPVVTPYPDGFKWGLYYEDGVVKHEGAEFRGAGFNCYDAFAGLIDNPDDEGYFYNFKMLAEYDVPYIRLNFGAYWPNQYELYDKDPEEFFRRMDKVVRCAEAFDIGLICSMFWYDTGLTDYCDEPRNTGWGDENSKTREFMRRYTTDVVNRYKNSPAIWVWEFGNEYNLGMDLPNASSCRPAIHESLGTRTERTYEDDMKLEDIMDAQQEFAELVRSLDPWRLITTGHSVPRAGQWHQYMYKSWGPDDREQATEALSLLTPDPFDTISVHLYTPEKWFDGIKTNADYVGYLAEAAKELNKCTFIGEFGGDFSTLGRDVVTAQINEILEAMKENEIDLGAIWCVWNPFDFSKDADNIQPNNKNAFVLDLVKQYNQQVWAQIGYEK
ncbi:MAG: glycoside hydrolase family 5 protein [Ruminococcaceae bacterium]|nr:glycoside hydrolase family 5 protein [Oscillospiraceae bacterium]